MSASDREKKAAAGKRCGAWSRLAGAVAAALLLGIGAAAAATPVRVGISNTSSDVEIFIAQKNGYFRDEGLDVTAIPFDSAAKMIGPLGSGELDVGSGSDAAGLYNAVARGIKLKIVADAASAPPHYGHNILLIRKDLVASGRYKTLKDLRGMSVALTAPGASSNAMLNDVLREVGLKFSDITPVYLGYPNHVVALINKKVDAGLTAEPAATQAIDAGAAVRVSSDDVFAPYHEAAILLYSADFAQRRDVAEHFMRAYVRAIRFYNDALKNGKLAGPTASQVIAILTEFTPIKDPAVYRAISPQGCDPNGHINVASLRDDFDFYKQQNWIEGKVTVDQVMDTSFVDAADKSLGPYKRQ